MTCGELFEDLKIFYILLIIDNLLGVMITICVIMMMVSFFGKEGKITRSALLPMVSFFVLVGSVYFLFLGYDYINLRKTWNDPVQEGIQLLTKNRGIMFIFRMGYYTSIVLAVKRVFKRDRIINSIFAVLLTILLQVYLMVVIEYSIAYFFEDPWLVVIQARNLEGEMGLSLSIIIVFALTITILTIILALYFGMIRKQRTLYISWKYRILFVVWEIIMVGVNMIPFIPSLSDLEHEKYMGYNLGFIIPILGLVVPFIFIMIISRRNALERTLVQENYISAELNYINQYKKNQNETRAFRHDIINNLSLLSVMYNEKHFDEAGDYLKTLLGEVRAMSPKYITGDEMLDCIVGLKASKMDEKGIDFSIDGVVDGGLGMKPVDVCSIFANALDNAIEACEKISDEDEKWIKLEIKRTDKFFSIIMRNTMVEDDSFDIVEKLFGENVSTKKDKSLHGFGALSMKSAISQYDGIEKVDVKDGIFTLSIMVPRASKNQVLE